MKSLVRMKDFEKVLGVKQLWMKNEMNSETGSHKDRESKIIIKRASDLGFKKIGCASTGNAAISLSYYAKKHFLDCHIFVPKSIDPEKLFLIQKNSPQIHFFDGTFAETYDYSNKVIEQNGFFNANPGICKVRSVGDEEIGEEIAEVKPTIVSCPTNNGTHIGGVWNGIKKYCKPKMIAAVCEKTQIATSIGGFAKKDYNLLESTIQESNGKTVNVTDSEILEITKQLYSKKIFCEPSSAASLAVLKKIKLSPDDVVVWIATANCKRFPNMFLKINNLL